MSEGCGYCDVLAGRAEGPQRAFDDARYVVFMGRFQPTGPGYALVIPRTHVDDLHALTDEECGGMLATLRRVSDAVVRAFDGVTSTTIMQNNGRPAQSVAHLHFHVVPRWEGDGYPCTTDTETPVAELASQARQLRVGLTDVRVDEVRATVAAHRTDALVVDDLRADEVSNVDWSGSPSHLRSVATAIARGHKEVEYLAVRAPDGQPVSKGGIDFTQRPGNGVLWQLATMEQLQSLGLGTRLIEEAERRIRARGIPFAALGVEDHNVRARALYERLGYVPFGRESSAWDQEDEHGNISRYETVLTLMHKAL